MSRCEVFGTDGLPEVRAGDDLGELLADALPSLADGDIVVLTSKVVSKAEGRRRTGDRDALVDEETARVVAHRGGTRIVETRHGFVLAAAGVDASNTLPGTALLLPADPDASARGVRAGLRDRLGVRVAVVVSDTFGRPWRLGLTDVAIGVAGMDPLGDLRGRMDPYGNPLDVTVTATADELAAAGDLVKGKLAGVPAAVVRGLGHLVTDTDGPGATGMVRPSAEDMFAYGAADVVPARRTVTEFRQDPVDPAVLRRAVAAALTAPGDTADEEAPPWRFVLATSIDVRKRVAEAMAGAEQPDAPGREHIGAVRQAPCLVVVCEDETAYGNTPGQVRAAAAGAAVENLLVALAAERVGSCWLPHPPGLGEIGHELGLPAAWQPMGVIAAGHPATLPPEHPRHNPEALIITR